MVSPIGSKVNFFKLFLKNLKCGTLFQEKESAYSIMNLF